MQRRTARAPLRFYSSGGSIKIKVLLQGVAKVYSTFLPWQGDPVGDEGRRIHHYSNRPHKVDAGRPTVPRILTSRKVQIQGSTLLRHHFQHSCKDGTTGGNKGEVINIQEATHPLPRDMTTQSAFPPHKQQSIHIHSPEAGRACNILPHPVLVRFELKRAFLKGCSSTNNE